MDLWKREPATRRYAAGREDLENPTARKAFRYAFTTRNTVSSRVYSLAGYASVAEGPAVMLFPMHAHLMGEAG